MKEAAGERRAVSEKSGSCRRPAQPCSLPGRFISQRRAPTWRSLFIAPCAPSPSGPLPLRAAGLPVAATRLETRPSLRVRSIRQRWVTRWALRHNATSPFLLLCSLACPACSFEAVSKRHNAVARLLQLPLTSDAARSATSVPILSTRL